MLMQTVIQTKELWASMTVIRSLFHSIINVNVLIDFWERLFISFRKSLILINDVICSIIFLLKLTVVIIVIFIVFKLIILICSFIIVYLKLLQIVKLVNIFVSLIVLLLSSVLIRLTTQIWVFIFWCRLYQLIFISRSLQWNYNCTDRSLLIDIEWEVLIHWMKWKRVLIHWTKRKRVLKKTLNWAVWQKKRELTIRRLILRLIQSLTREVKTKTIILTVSILFKSRDSIFAVLITVTLTAHALSLTYIMSVHISLSVLFEFESLNELTNCDSISRWVNKDLKISDDILIDEDKLIFNTLNVDWLDMA